MMYLRVSLLLLLRLAGVAVAYKFDETLGGDVDGAAVYTVTKVTDDEDDAKTLRGAIAAAIDASGPAMIKFDIPCDGPFIELTETLTINGARDLTIDGSDQSGGVTIAHFDTKSKNCEDLVLRNLRFRPGRYGVDQEISEKEGCKPGEGSQADKDSCGTGNDALTLRTCKNCLVEHCSFGLATDESLSIEASRRVILRRNIIGTGITAGGYTHFERNSKDGPRKQSYHNFGSLWNANDDVVAHDNIWSNFDDRCPQLEMRSACCDGDGKQTTELEDENDDCPSGSDFCLNQDPTPNVYLYNNIIVGCGKGTTLKAYRGVTNLWKNVYLNGDSGQLSRSIYYKDGECKNVQSRKHVFEKSFDNVDGAEKSDYPSGHNCDCGKDGKCDDNPNETGSATNPKTALAEAVTSGARGAQPLDEFDVRIIEGLVKDKSVPTYTGYYPDIVDGEEPAMIAINDDKCY